MTSLLIVYKDSSPHAKGLAEKVKKYAEGKKFQCKVITFQDNMDPQEAISFHLALSIGGDGTYLYTARLLASKPIPILPINMGRFGYITETAAEEWETALESFLCGEMTISSRLILEILHNRNGDLLSKYHAVNDGVVTTQGISRMVDLTLRIDEKVEGQFRGDGLILATPTGSTAYSMAAGGPIVHPELNALLLTPICPFSLSFRPLVLPESEKVSLIVKENGRRDLILTLDGQETVPLKPGDEIVYRASKNRIQMVLSKQRSFLEVVQSKLGWSGGPDAGRT